MKDLTLRQIEVIRAVTIAGTIQGASVSLQDIGNLIVSIPAIGGHIEDAR